MSHSYPTDSRILHALDISYKREPRSIIEVLGLDRTKGIELASECTSSASKEQDIVETLSRTKDLEHGIRKPSPSLYSGSFYKGSINSVYSKDLDMQENNKLDGLINCINNKYNEFKDLFNRTKVARLELLTMLEDFHLEIETVREATIN